MATFFTADTHFGHRTIIEKCRPWYRGIDEMDEDLIKQWNRQVSPKDDVFILGDVSFRSSQDTAHILSRLNGGLFLISGNHDGPAHRARQRFRWIKDLHETHIEDPESPTGNGRRKVVLFHYPMITWNGFHRGSFHFHGHSHGNLENRWDAFRMDVGIDANWKGEEMVMITPEMAIEHMRKCEPVSRDHHRAPER